MKKLFRVLFVAVSFGILFTSCTKDDDYGDVVEIEVRLRNASNGGGGIELIEIDSAYRNYSYNEYYSTKVWLAISTSNNFYAYYSPSYYCSENIECSIACVGNVNSLGKIRNIPSSGWSDQVAVNPGKGYIVRSKNNNPNGKWHFARVYVKNWITGASNGGIIGAVVSYQPDWKLNN